jgi:Tol biopolymer transport system component
MGEVTETQIAGFLVSLLMKKPTITEVAAIAQATEIISIPSKHDINIKAALSPDGKTIFYIDKDYNIATINLSTLANEVIRSAYPYDEKNPENIKPSESIIYTDLKLSPDGQKAAVYWSGNKWTSMAIMNTNGSNFVRIQSPVASELSFANFDWSPDSKKFAIACINNEISNTDGCLYIASADHDGEGIQVLPMNNEVFPNRIKDAYNPKWSPDGTKIVFSYRTSDKKTVENIPGVNEIFSINSDGSSFKKLSDNKINSMDPFWLDNQNLIYLLKDNKTIEKLAFNSVKNEEFFSKSDIDRIDSVSNDKKYLIYSTANNDLSILDLSSKKLVNIPPMKGHFIGWIE